MKAFLLFSGSGTMVVLTPAEDIENKQFLEKLAVLGISKFIAYEIPLALAKERYGHHFDLAAHELAGSKQLRVLDYNGERAMRLFKFDELGAELRYEPDDYTEHKLI
ncbi:MAG: hypothetical protein ACU83N_15760 [Gammaproteobacteria bacterium]